MGSGAIVLVLAGGLVAYAGVSNAEVFCQQVGNQTYCSNGQLLERFGNTTNDRKGNSWQHFGNQTYGSDGTLYQRDGTQTFVNRGGRLRRFDNQPYNGTSCKQVGQLVFCE